MKEHKDIYMLAVFPIQGKILKHGFQVAKKKPGKPVFFLK